MKLAKFKTALFLVASILLFASCEEKLQTEFGNSRIYFSNPVYPIIFSKLDTVALPQILAQADTTYQTVGVYRSGLVDNLEEITVSLAIDSAYLDSVINVAQTALPVQMTDQMTLYKNSKALGGAFFSIPSTVTIPQGERRVIVPLLMRRSLIKMYNNAKFNYNTADLASTTMPKDKMLVLPIKITAVSSLSILEKQLRFYFQIRKRF